MGEARMVADRLTEAMFKGDWTTVEQLYAPDAVAVTPDQGELKGRGEIIQYLKSFVDSMPDGKYSKEHGHESGNTAIDEGFVDGTNTGPLPLPTGETLPPTGKRIHVRGCDIMTVENGMVSSHRFYFDQMEFLGQLGLLPEMPTPG
jgi:ketosteroid isomerase-like protein